MGPVLDAGANERAEDPAMDIEELDFEDDDLDALLEQNADAVAKPLDREGARAFLKKASEAKILQKRKVAGASGLRGHRQRV